MSYRPFGGAKAMNTGGGGTVSSQFDDAGRITISNPGAVHEETFTYDNNGNLTSITSPSLPYHNRVYNYDVLDRLEHAEGPLGVIDYTYDGLGNRLTKTVDSTTETYSYVPGSNIIDSVANGTDVTYTHDANGNITGINNMVLAYNQDNRLVSVEEDSVTLGEYTYNGLAQRIIKEAGGVTTVFHYDFDGNIIGESDLSGTFSKEYLYRGSSRLAMVDVSSGDIYFYGNDHLGTPSILTDSTNTVVWEAVYKPSGEAEVNPNSEVVSNFRFNGQYYDSETGFHYNYLRYCEPSTGRYLTPDPIGQAGGINLYTYVENNPINITDPLGLSTARAKYLDLMRCGEYQQALDLAILMGLGIPMINNAQNALNKALQSNDSSDEDDVCENDDPDVSTPASPDPNDPNLSDKIPKIAKEFGRTRKEIEDAIHSVKRSGLPRGQGNPNVSVDLNTGEVYPHTSRGLGDSIGNIYNYLK